MRALLLPSLLLLVAAGCLSEEAFNEKYDEKMCEEFKVCVTAETATCDELPKLTEDTAACEFDEASARDCLRGLWVCDEQFPGYEIPIPPAACASVCGTDPATVGTADDGAEI
jgi:hypothetical protein